jgi:two-component system chemotaxis response regulator CheB
VRLVVVAASAGGLRTVRQILSALPTGFPAALALVWHRSTAHPHVLGDLLRLWTTLPVVEVDAVRIPVAAGVLYVAPPDRNLVVGADRMLGLDDGQLMRETFASADALFTSAAAVFGRAVIAVVLTGHQNDGAAGVRAVKLAGGVVVVQDPTTATAPDMPRAALATGTADHVLPVELIARALVDLTAA